MNKYKIALCRFPGSGWERAELTTWLMQTFHKMKQDERIEGVLSIVKSDTPITMTRNAAVKEALAAGCDYILMVDSDMEPDYLVGADPHARPFWDIAWEFMMERESMYENGDIRMRWATVAAPYCGPPPHECVYVFRWTDSESETPNPNFGLQMLERHEIHRYTGIQEVAALPTGLILYDARVFKELKPPWYDYEYSDPEHSIKGSTEDVFQTRNASQLGMPQYCAWSCWAKHWKTKGVGKPVPLTIDQVHHSLEEAFKRGHKSGERVHFVTRNAAARDSRALAFQGDS